MFPAKSSCWVTEGIANGVPGLEILDSKKAHEMEPNLSDEVVAAIYCPTGGIVCPFGMNIAFAENAAANGVEFLFNTEVKEIQKEQAGYILITQNGEIHARCVVNAAGVYGTMFCRHFFMVPNPFSFAFVLFYTLPSPL